MRLSPAVGYASRVRELRLGFGSAAAISAEFEISEETQRSAPTQTASSARCDQSRLVDMDTDMDMDMEAIFSSLAGGDALRARVLELIADASSKAKTNPVEVNVMTFSFTDSQIADCLAAAVREPRLTMRLISDWTQRAVDGHQQVGRLAQLGLPNLKVRYKKDQPYVWDAAGAHMRWSYSASRGLLHHKTLSIVVDGEPWRLVCGSANWTAKAADSYENLLIVTNSTAGSRELMSRVEIEFEALWSDGTASLSPDDAQAHYEAVANTYRRNAMAAPSSINGLPQGRADALRILNSQHYTWNESVSQKVASSQSRLKF